MMNDFLNGKVRKKEKSGYGSASTVPGYKTIDIYSMRDERNVGEFLERVQIPATWSFTNESKYLAEQMQFKYPNRKLFFKTVVVC